MQNKIIFQIIYAEATAIVYDRSRINRTRAALYRLANFYGIDVKSLTSNLKANREAQRDAAAKLGEQDDLSAAVAVMGTMADYIGVIAAHVHAPIEDTNLPQIGQDIFAFLLMLGIIEKLPTAKVA